MQTPLRDPNPDILKGWQCLCGNELVPEWGQQTVRIPEYENFLIQSEDLLVPEVPTFKTHDEQWYRLIGWHCKSSIRKKSYSY